jgi:fatty-acyl-CoA synthase
MFTLIIKLHRTRLLTIAGLWYLFQAIRTTGINLMTLLRVAAKLRPDRVAVTDDQEQLSYTQLWEQAESLAVVLHVDYGVCSQQKVAIVCRNHAAAIKAVFAVSRLGAHLYLLNPEMSADQLLALEDRLQFDFVIYDEQIAHVFKNSSLRNKSLPAYHPTDPSIDRLSSRSRSRQVQLNKMETGNIVVMTGGTTGQPKSASRKPSILDYLPLLFAFLTQAHLDRYQSVYIATPICHGYGLSFLFMGVALGVEMVFTERFDALRACSVVAAHRIQVMIVVPLILRRMLNLDPGSLSSLQCIITGSALLRPALAQETLEQLGPILFNLYGSSEAGFSIMATPDVLSKKPESIGKPVQGVRAKIVNASGQQVDGKMIGQVCIRSTWTSNRKSWIETGDLAYRDPEGDLYLCGRVDELIVSGGENVYPIELENILTRHPDIDSAAVFGIPDEEFGQRLKAVVVKKRDAALDQSTLLDWLKPRVARYQMPAIIEFRDELPHTSIGKLDKRSL